MTFKYTMIYHSYGFHSVSLKRNKYMTFLYDIFIHKSIFVSRQPKSNNHQQSRLYLYYISALRRWSIATTAWKKKYSNYEKIYFHSAKSGCRWVVLCALNANRSFHLIQYTHSPRWCHGTHCLFIVDIHNSQCVTYIYSCIQNEKKNHDFFALTYTLFSRAHDVNFTIFLCILIIT